MASCRVGRVLTVAAALGAAVAGCGSPDQAQKALELGAGDPPGGSGQSDADLGQGWEEVITIASGTEIKFDVTGHFNSSRGLCSYQREFGKIPLEIANSLIRNTNQANSAPFRSDEYCIEARALKHVSSYADLQIKRPDRRSLFVPRGGEMCTKIQDQRVARELLDALDQAVGIALKEGCRQP